MPVSRGAVVPALGSVAPVVALPPGGAGVLARVPVYCQLWAGGAVVPLVCASYLVTPVVTCSLAVAFIETSGPVDCYLHSFANIHPYPGGR